MDVRLPNGEMVTGVPEGMSKADLVAKLRAAGHDMSWVDGPAATPQPAVDGSAPQEIGDDFAQTVNSTPGMAQTPGMGLVQGVADVVQNVPKFFKRSGARLVEGLTELPSATAAAVGKLAGSANPSAADSAVGSGIANARPDDLTWFLDPSATQEGLVEAQAQWDAEHEGKDPADFVVADITNTPVADKFSTATRKAAAPVTESRPVVATREWAQSKQKEAEEALTPAARRALELSLVEHDEEDNMVVGEGASDPWWWTANVIDVGVQAAPGLGTTGVAARMSYASKYRQVLGELAAQKIPQSLAIKSAEKQALAAAKRAAVISGGLTEGAVAGGQDAAQVRATIESLNEETLMSYPGYMELRDEGMTHEQAREEIASDKAAAVAIASGAVVGLTGAPMNAYFGRLAAKFGRVAQPAGKLTRLAEGAKAAAGEGAQEFVQEGAEQLIQNKAEQSVGLDVDTWDGVLEGAITGATLGAVIGAPIGVAGHKSGKAPAETPADTKPTDTPAGPAPLNPVAQAEDTYVKSQSALADVLTAARDPNTKITYEQVQKAREAHKQALVDYTRELMHSGAIKEKDQPQVAEALKQAETEGIVAKTRKPAAAGDVSPARDAALEAAANAQQLEEADANDLISTGLAKVNPRGIVVLTPEGRRQRKAAQERAEAEKESSQPAAKKPAETVAKPAAKPVKQKLRIPAERREIAVQREAQRATAAAARRAKPHADAAAERADKTVTPESIKGRANELAASDAAHAEFGAEPVNPQMRDAFKAAVDARERARRGLPAKSSGKRVAFRLKGQPETAEIPGQGKVKVEPVAAAKTAATAYRKAKGITTPEPTEYVKVDVPRAKRIAKAFDEMKHEPNNPEVKRAYRAMIDETKAQWDEIKKTGLKVEFIKAGQKDPYAVSPRMAIEDVRKNNHLWVFPTDSGFGSDNKFTKDNPMLEDTGESIGGHKLKANDVFRIVHDYFGHVQEANGFRADGEENAWQIHASMYSPAARRAMTTETRGQNSWVNYGPKGEANRKASAGETTYADQKIGLLPAEFSALPGEKLKFKHFSNLTDDQIELDPEKMGTGAKGAEAKRGGPRVASLYAEAGEVEPDVANGRTRYDVEVPAGDLYNASEDTAGLLRQAQVPYGMTTDAQGNTVPVGTRFDMNKFEELVRDAGYLGYHTPDAQGILKGQARLFQKYPATKYVRPEDRPVSVALRAKRKTDPEKVLGRLSAEERSRLKKSTTKRLIEIFDELPDGADFAATALAGQAKRGWYRRSAEALSNVFGPDAPRFAALLAALSPQTSVEWNFRNAVATWVGWDKAGRPQERAKIIAIMRENMFPSTARVGNANILPAWINNTVKALTTENPSTVTLSGPKVDSFAANLRGETERVTLDAWMANWAGVNQMLFKGGAANDTNPGLRPGYLAYTARVREAAQILTERTGETWTPAEVQETVWSWAKTLYEEAESYGALATAREILDNKELTDDLINATPDFAGLFEDPQIAASLRGTVYGPRAARSAGEAAATGRPGREATPTTEDDSRRLRKAADRLDALRKSRKDAEDANRADGLRTTPNAPTRGISRADMDAVAERVRRELGVRGTVVETQADLPDYAQAQIPEGIRATGLIVEDEITGESEIFFVHENIDSVDEAYENALHEIVGHMGLRAVLGDNYHKAMEQVRLSFPAAVAAAATRNNIDMEPADFAARRRNQSLAAEELIAYAAGRVLADRGALGKQNVWRKIIAKVRDILRGVGLLNSYSDADIDALIYSARDFFLRKPASVRASLIEYQARVAASAKLESDSAPQWLSPDEYLSEDTKNIRERLDAARMPPGGFTEDDLNPAPNLEGRAPQPGRVKEQVVFAPNFDAVMAGNAPFEGTEVTAYADGKSIGYVSLSERGYAPGKNGSWVADYVYVHPDYRGKGVAQRMYKAISDKLGVAVMASADRTALGSKMWESFERRNVAFSFKQGPTGDPELDSFIKKIGVQPMTLRQRWNEFSAGLAQRFIVGALDPGYGVLAAERDAGIRSVDSGYKSWRLHKKAGDLTAGILRWGAPTWFEGAPIIRGKRGFLDIVAPLGNDLNLWAVAMVGRRADRLKGEGRENLFPQNEIDAANRLWGQYPQFKVVADEYAKLQKSILDFAQEAGVIDPTTRPLWENQDHIPFYRVMDNGAPSQSMRAGKGVGFVKRQTIRLKGGTNNIGDPIENIIRNWSMLMDASLKAHAGRQIIDNFDGTGLVVKVDTPPVLPSNPSQLTPEIETALRDLGVDPQALSPANVARFNKLFAVHAPAGEDVISVWRAGKKEQWHLIDPLLIPAFEEMNDSGMGVVKALLSFPKRVVTAGITMVPSFGIANFLRDPVHSFVMGSKVEGKKVSHGAHKAIGGAISILTANDSARAVISGGGAFLSGQLGDGDAASTARLVRRTLARKQRTGVARIIDSPRAAWRLYRDLMTASENATRVTRYEASRKAGLSHKESAYEALNLMDFSLQGRNAFLRLLTWSVPFLNARLQGMYRGGESLRSDLGGTALRGALVAMFTLALLARNADDDRYKELSDADKANYWHVWDVLAPGDHVQIPKPFETGVVFANTTEALFDSMVTNADEPDRARQALAYMGFSLEQQLAMSPEVQLVWPIVELGMNKDSFTKAPILTGQELGRLPEDQVAPNTRPTYKLMAENAPSWAPEALRSPKQLEHLTRGYLGSAADYVTAATDVLADTEASAVEQPASGVPLPTVIGRFYKQGPARHTRYETEMYTLANEAKKIENSMKFAEDQESDAGDARIEQLETENESVLAVGDDFQAAAKEVGALKKQQREIRVDPGMSAEEKRTELDAIQKEINDIAKDVYDLRPGGKLNPETAADLLTAPPTARVKILRQNNMPATADLLEQFG